MSTEQRRKDLAAWWSQLSASATSEDYVLLGQLEAAFAARDRSGRPALVVPLASPPPTMVGRTAAGCELTGHVALRFLWQGRVWTGAAAVLTCTDAELATTFAVFASDVLTRVSGQASWPTIVTIVEEWLLLLSPRGRPSPEREAGLWAELWFIAHAADLGRVFAGWRGPDGDAMDFFVDGVAVDIKASTLRRQHHVSLTQVGSPTGDHPAWLLSVWLKQDPAGSWTVPSLVDHIMARAPDHTQAIRQLSRAGFAPADRQLFTQRYAILSEPEWYDTKSVPQVRSVDPGVSQLRYRVTLDEARRADGPRARSLWQHFLRRDYGSLEQ